MGTLATPKKSQKTQSASKALFFNRTIALPMHQPTFRELTSQLDSWMVGWSWRCGPGGPMEGILSPYRGWWDTQQQGLSDWSLLLLKLLIKGKEFYDLQEWYETRSHPLREAEELRTAKHAKVTQHRNEIKTSWGTCFRSQDGWW